MNKELLSLSEQRLHQLKSILVDAGLRSEQISIDKESVDEYPITLTVSWRFHAKTISKTYVSTAPSGSHRVSDTNELNKAISQEKNKLEKNLNSHYDFLTNTVSLSKSDQTQIVSKSPSYHIHITCISCSGKGLTNCGFCQGRKKQRCSNCDGKGYTSTPDSSPMCLSCWGKKEVQCTHCGGSGGYKCNRCTGKGSHINHSHVELEAIPSCSVSIDPLISNHQVIHQYLSSLSPSQLSTLGTGLQYVSLDSSSGARHHAEYMGTLVISTIYLSLPVNNTTQQYKLIYLGRQIDPINPPTLLDDVLEKKIAELSQLNSKPITPVVAQQLFSKITSIELMNQTLKKVASLKSPSNEDTQHAIMSLTNGYLSSQSARTLSLVFHNCLSKISPVYSKLAWILVSAPLALIVFLMSTENIPRLFALHRFLGFIGLDYLLDLFLNAINFSPLHYSLSLHLFIYTLFIFIDTLALLTLSLVIIIPLSMILRQISLRKLPKAYRLPAKHLKPFKYVALILCGVALLSIFIGYFR